MCIRDRYDDQPTEDRSKIDEKTSPEEIEIEEEVIVEQTPEPPVTRDEDDIDSFFG